MGTSEKHCRESLALFGQPFEKIYLWLDEFQGWEPYGMRHRRLRHHEAGVCQVVALFGPEAEGVPPPYHERPPGKGLEGAVSFVQRRSRFFGLTTEEIKSKYCVL
jgi:hypothetical protein